MLITSAVFQARPGKSEEAAGRVLGIFQAASKATGVPFMVWGGVAGVPFGSFLGSARFDNMAHYLESGQKMSSDAEFKKATLGLDDTMAGPTETFLNEVIAVTGEVGDPKPLVLVTRATLVAANLTAGLGWSTKVAQYVTDATGVGGTVTISKAGPMFQVSWLGGVQDGAQLDEVDGKLNGDANYLAMIEAGSQYFIPGSSQRVLIARIG